MNFDDRLAAAASKPRPHADVQIVLDQDAAEERDRLVEALGKAEAEDAADQRLSMGDVRAAPIRAALEALNTALQDSLVTLRFVRLPGDKWAELTWKNLPRKDYELDTYYGYNIDAAVRLAAAYEHPDTHERFGFRVEQTEDGQQLVPMTDEQWGQLFDVVTGSEAASIRDAVWRLNDFGPSEHIEALVKGSGTATRPAEK